MVPTWLLKPLEKYCHKAKTYYNFCSLLLSRATTKGHPLLGSSLFPTATWVSANIWTLKNIYRQTDFYMASKTLVSHLKFHFRNKKKRPLRSNTDDPVDHHFLGQTERWTLRFTKTQRLSDIWVPWSNPGIKPKNKRHQEQDKISLLHAQWNFP